MPGARPTPHPARGRRSSTPAAPEIASALEALTDAARSAGMALGPAGVVLVAAPWAHDTRAGTGAPVSAGQVTRPAVRFAAPRRAHPGPRPRKARR
ncbi:hypothetical protein GCM10010430_11960 [Kitasatospora cystarginea]|uniref:Uncharacterized protein n=1 Tax=Kitasatospora cystarginea TaxID=58350 RepID=A0ABP5QDW9_9ACTN